MLHKFITMLILGGTLSVTGGCGAFSPRVTIATDPSGAEVATAGGDSLGTTPLRLDAVQMAKATEKGRLHVRLRAPGHVEREVVLDIVGEDSHLVHLAKVDATTFDRYLLGDFHDASNRMIRDLLRIQGLVGAKQLTEAATELAAFQKTYPNIAAGYAIQAGIELARGKRDLAHDYLLRARTLDPQDATVQRLLHATEGGAP